MNSLTEAIPMKVTTIRKSSLKDRLFTACYLTATAVAMLGWLSRSARQRLRLQNGCLLS